MKALDAAQAPTFLPSDTIGAGDAFTAGLLLALAEADIASSADLDAMTPKELNVVLAFARSVAAAICTRTGADPPRRHELASLPGE